MWIGNNLVRSVCLAVWAVTLESQELGSSFSVCRNTLTIFRSSSSVKVIGSK